MSVLVRIWSALKEQVFQLLPFTVFCFILWSGSGACELGLLSDETEVEGVLQEHI